MNDNPTAMRIADLPDPFADLPALAERLGVSKLGPDRPNDVVTIVMTMKNGDRYSLFELINALLDRMDQTRGLLAETSRLSKEFVAEMGVALRDLKDTGAGYGEAGGGSRE